MSSNPLEHHEFQLVLDTAERARCHSLRFASFVKSQPERRLIGRPLRQHRRRPSNRRCVKSDKTAAIKVYGRAGPTVYRRRNERPKLRIVLIQQFTPDGAGPAIEKLRFPYRQFLHVGHENPLPGRARGRRVNLMPPSPDSESCRPTWRSWSQIATVGITRSRC